MKKAILFLLILALVLPVVSACSSNTKEISVYFKAAQTNEISAEKRKVDKNLSLEDVAKFAVNEMIKGPSNEKNAPVISKNAKLLSLDIVGNIATVNFSSHYPVKKGAEELLLRLCLVNTLCSLEGIDAILIQVEGKPLLDKDGKELPPLGMNDYIDPETTLKETLKLYFPSSDGTKLESETRAFEIQNTLSWEKAVVTELINGPKKSGLSPSIAAGTKLLGIETKDKVCYVNFSKEFINTSGSSLETTLVLYSVVNSLCELENVESVQILIDGETGAEFGNFVLDIPYEANMDYVK